VTSESSFIALMRSLATDPAARNLLDDAAVIDLGNETLILTHDMLAEGVHWLPLADPADVAWKLVSVNLSDLAAKGARPLGVLLGFMLGDSDWDRHFAEGLKRVIEHYGAPLLGGDTVSNRGDKRALGLTAIGAATHKPVPSRAGARAGDVLYVTGTLGDALAGFELVEAGLEPPDMLSADRMASASKACFEIDITAIPLSAAYRAYRGDSRDSRLQAASWGDDYQLLFTAPEGAPLPVPAMAVGRVVEGAGLALFDGAERLPLPPTLGYQHG
jgi:thiamine-monophosphate kinase